jgi:hypothetical protein
MGRANFNRAPISGTARAAVKPMTMLVTSDGQWLSEGGAELAAMLGDADPDYDAAGFAIRNLGFIRFQMLGDSLVEIELHPARVELPALLAVQQQLLSARVKLFRIKYLEMSWKSEITSSAEGAVSRLSALCTPAFIPISSQKYVVEPQDYSSLLSNEQSRLRLMAQKWRMSFGEFSPSVISFAIEHQLLSRMMIAGIKPHSAEPVFRFIGDGFSWLTRDYQFHALGEKIENLPDKEYGAWVAEFYKAVANTGQPRYDHVTALIETAGAEVGPYLTRYERLLLPWRTPSSEILVSLSSLRLDDAVSAPDSSPIPQNSRSSTLAKSS